MTHDPTDAPRALPPFAPTDHCPKCAGSFGLAKYHAANPHGVEPAEHLTRCCMSCEYMGRYAPLDRADQATDDDESPPDLVAPLSLCAVCTEPLPSGRIGTCAACVSLALRTQLDVERCRLVDAIDPVIDDLALRSVPTPERVVAAAEQLQAISATLRVIHALAQQAAGTLT